MKVYNDRIPKHKLSQFDEILKATGGRYLSNPRFSRHDDCFRVDYIPGETTSQTWSRCLEDVGEVRKDQWWRKLLRRMKVGVLCG